MLFLLLLLLLISLSMPSLLVLLLMELLLVNKAMGNKSSMTMDFNNLAIQIHGGIVFFDFPANGCCPDVKGVEDAGIVDIDIGTADEANGNTPSVNSLRAILPSMIDGDEDEELLLLLLLLLFKL